MNSYMINKKPQILSLASSRVEEWSRSSWKWLTRFRTTLLQRVRDNRRQSSRTMRKEQRESIAKVLQVLFEYLDLNTLCVGFYHKEANVFVHLSLNFLAKKANLSLRRTQRAMTWLYQSGYVTGFRQSLYNEDEDVYYHKPSIRRINPKLLLDLGITEIALEGARARSKGRFEKSIIESLIKEKISKSKFNSQAGGHNITSFIKNLTKPFLLSKNSKSADPPPAYKERVTQLMTLMPHLSVFEAKKMLPPPETYASV